MAALQGLPHFLLPAALAGALQAVAPQPTLLGGAPGQPLDHQQAHLLPPAAVQALQLGLPLPGGGGGGAALGALGLAPPQPPPAPAQDVQQQQQQQQQQHPALQYSLETLAPHQTAAVVKAAQAAAAVLAHGGGRDLLYVNPKQLAAIQRRREKRERQEARMRQLVAKAVSARVGWHVGTRPLRFHAAAAFLCLGEHR